jgi:hypothetical protein
VPDEPRRRELGVALDELEADPELVRDGTQQRGLARARWPLEQHVAVGGQGGDDEFDLAPPPDDAASRSTSEVAVDRRASWTDAQSNTMTPRMFSPSRIAW